MFAVALITAALCFGTLISAQPPPYPIPFPFDRPDCDNGYLANYDICDHTLPYLQRARSMIPLMNISEKIVRMSTLPYAAAIDRIGLPTYQWWSESLHGMMSAKNADTFADSGRFEAATQFPAPIGLGAAFDDELIYNMAQVISTEGRAFNNDRRVGLDVWSPVVNLYRDPRWGRGQETPGEDPMHVAAYAYAFIDGLQNGEDNRYTKIISSCKHYVANDLEQWNGYQRINFSANVTPQELVEYFLVPFETCVRDAHGVSIMCSLNAVNGVPACANGYLMNTIARGLWHFDRWQGYMVTDCAAIPHLQTMYHYVNSQAEAAAVALIAGVDVECGTTYSGFLGEALNQSLITEDLIDQALIRQFSALINLGYFDPNHTQPYLQYGPDVINTSSSQNLTLRAAQESIVLLKNDGLLPIQLQGKRVAVIGPWSDNTNQGGYSGKAPYLISLRMALQQSGIDIMWETGCAINGNSSDTTGFAAALKAAAASDLIIFAGGIDTTLEHEGIDRYNISWPGMQMPLMQQLETLSKPMIVIRFGGGQCDDTYLKQSSSVNALLWAGYPSQRGGQAILSVLVGEYAPAGRLPVTQYPNDFVNEAPFNIMTLRPNTTNNYPGRTYLWYTGTPVYPFGYGLHYTTFTYTLINDATTSIRCEYDIAELMSRSTSYEFLDQSVLGDYIVNVTNTGSVTSDTVVLVFNSMQLDPSVYNQPVPHKELVAYARPHLILPGETRTVYFTLTLRAFSRVDEDGHRWLYPGKYRLVTDINHDSDNDDDHHNHAELIVVLRGEPFRLIEWPKDPQTHPLSLSHTQQSSTTEKITSSM